MTCWKTREVTWHSCSGEGEWPRSSEFCLRWGWIAARLAESHLQTTHTTPKNSKRGTIGGGANLRGETSAQKLSNKCLALFEAQASGLHLVPSTNQKREDFFCRDRYAVDAGPKPALQRAPDTCSIASEAYSTTKRKAFAFRFGN